MGARKYERTISTWPDIDLFDWQLLERLSALLEEYKGSNGSMRIYAKDTRGTFEAETLAEFQEEVARQDDPHSWTLRVNRTDIESGYDVWLQVWTSDEPFMRGAKFESTQEADVVYVAERTTDLFEQAHARRKERIASERRSVPRKSRGFGFWRDVSSEAIGGAFAAGIVAVVIAVWAIFFH
jgi:hypothetical protein